MTASLPAHSQPLWLSELKHDTSVRPPLSRNAEFDVVIIGGGFTGLWSAYYLKMHAPTLRVAILEAEFVGYGASGRNGGWLSHLVPGNRRIYADGPRGLDGSRALQVEMVRTVDEVLGVAAQLGWEIEAKKSGNLVAATTRAGMGRLISRHDADLKYGLQESETHVLTAHDVSERIAVAGAVGGLFHPTVARVNPGKLVDALAREVESQGVRIYEHSAVTQVGPRMARTARGIVTADHVLICTEGYSGPLLGTRRIVPITSSMIATNPLKDDQWDAIGWKGEECFSDAAHSFVYAQRTADGRIAIGGRGRPYLYRSKIDRAGRCHPDVVAALLERLRTYFPSADLSADYAWSGVLGVSRDWGAGVDFDRVSGIGSSVGYAGHGVASANLGARVLVDLLLERDTDLVTLPLVGHRPRNWEFEPARWIGVHAMYRLMQIADRREEGTNASQTSRIARVAGRFTGLGE